ncbi:unnamed protein product [Orchesella dallaii]|uniref:S1 motif domain-containing protein n=1 Tax=Orchesella dallaii TaxID=48710 RepID=A0ABP1PW88_9HEXA
MSEFGSVEAEESEMDMDGEVRIKQEGLMTQKKLRKIKFSEVPREDGDEGENEEDDLVVQDLIDDNPIDEDGSEADESDDGKRKRKVKSDDELYDSLEDDDYDLIEENLGVKVQRKKFKRLRQIDDDDSDQELAQAQGDDREAIANHLFEGSDNEDDRDRSEPLRDEATREYASEESEGEYSETDDFIVDDDGRPLKEARRKRKPIFTSATLQEAQSIFGVDFDFEEFEKCDNEENEEEEEDEYEGEENRIVRRENMQSRRSQKMKSIVEIYEPHELERAGFTDKDLKIKNQDIPERMQLRSVPITPADEAELDEEADWIFKLAFSSREAMKKQVEKAPASTVPAPAESEANWDQDWDKQTSVTTASGVQSTTGRIQAGKDNWEDDDGWKKPILPLSAPIPRPPATEVGGDGNWEEEGWETEPKKKLLALPAPQEPGDAGVVSLPVVERQEDVKPEIISKIRKALELMRNHLLEVPFIAFYRKENVQPDLSINDLWKIYRLDGRFCQLKKRRSRLLELFTNMWEHQAYLDLDRPDDPMSDFSVRRITEEDLARVKSIKSDNEMKDMYLFFSLYYADEVPNMKAGTARRQWEESQQSKNTMLAITAGPASVSSKVGDISKEVELVETPTPVPVMALDVVGKKPMIQRKVGGGAYLMCKKMGVESLVKIFGMSSAKFAENLRDNYLRNEVHQYPVDPLEAAKELLSEGFKTPEEVLKAAKLMLATQISREPDVRRCVREAFFERATISCCPTKKGQKEIDEAHPCFTMKYIKEKPVGELKEDQFLKLFLAEEDNLLSISLGENISGVTEPNYIDEVKQFFLKDEFSKVVQDWNQLRGECLEFAFEKLLYPVFRKELRMKLIDDARAHILKSSSEKIYNWLKIAPYHVEFPEEDEEEWDTSKGLRILTIAFADDFDQPAFACLVSPDGEPLEHLKLQNLIKSKKSYKESDRLEKMATLVSLKEFIRDKKPHLVVIGGESRDALMIQTDVQEIIEQLMNEDVFPSINIEIMDNQLAKVYANSHKAAHEFPEYPLLMKEAISLARRMLDPLLEFSQLCNPDEEILCLRFHPFQDHVPKEDLLDHVYVEFINRTNEVGVDLNRILSEPHTANVVQFVCGLGSRKAAALLKVLKLNSQRLENRTQLITVCHMGPKVFINCSGFIKINTNSLGENTEAYVEVLDGTRVHPEAYEWARKMAVDAFDYDEEDVNPASAVEEVIEYPEKLKELDLDLYAAELKKQGIEDKTITLYDIRAELNACYKDLRSQYQKPTVDELFNMLTKETPDTLYIGKLITATVTGIIYKKPQGDQLDNVQPYKNVETGMWECPFPCCFRKDFRELQQLWEHYDNYSCQGQACHGIRIRMDNGISGFIPISKLSDSQVTMPEERVRRGQTVYCRVVKIDVERFSVECTSRTSDLNDVKQFWKPEKDSYYDQEKEDNETKKEDDIRKSKQRQSYFKRVIVHPSFKNISYRDAEVLMEKMDQGEVIIRPSSRGADHLTVTWKVSRGICQHIDVKEEGKDKDHKQTLLIGDDEFEDLDEIIARHITPMASHARDLINFKYYVDTLGGSMQKAEEYLLGERAKNPNKIHYVLQVSKEYPGKFILSYFPRTKCLHEFVTVTPDGFRFRQQTFDSLDGFLNWFKKHYQTPPPGLSTPFTPRRFYPQVPSTHNMISPFVKIEPQ